MTESFLPEKEIKEKDFGKPKPQQVPPKPASKPLVATKTCIVQLPDCDCEIHLVKGQEVHGLSREERDHLKFHGFVE